MTNERSDSKATNTEANIRSASSFHKFYLFTCRRGDEIERQRNRLSQAGLKAKQQVRIRRHIEASMRDAGTSTRFTETELYNRLTQQTQVEINSRRSESIQHTREKYMEGVTHANQE